MPNKLYGSGLSLEGSILLLDLNSLSFTKDHEVPSPKGSLLVSCQFSPTHKREAFKNLV